MYESTYYIVVFSIDFFVKSKLVHLCRGEAAFAFAS